MLYHPYFNNDLSTFSMSSFEFTILDNNVSFIESSVEISNIYSNSNSFFIAKLIFSVALYCNTAFFSIFIVLI
jgi:hypothetical protein